MCISILTMFALLNKHAAELETQEREKDYFTTIVYTCI